MLDVNTDITYAILPDAHTVRTWLAGEKSKRLETKYQ